jgi:hypothetical protein
MNVIRCIIRTKSGRVGWARHTARMTELRNSYRFLVGKLERWIQHRSSGFDRSVVLKFTVELGYNVMKGAEYFVSF